MPTMQNAGVKVVGIAGAVPKSGASVLEIGKPYFSEEDIQKISGSVGTNTLHFAPEALTSGELGIHAARTLLDDLDWDLDSIDGLVFVSQNADFVVPPTSCRIQDALGLKQDILVMDLNYGCAGFSMGLMVVSQFIQTGLCKRVLLITSERHHQNSARDCLDTALIFGDGAAAIAIEKSDSSSVITFSSMADGSHHEDLILGWQRQATNPKISDLNHLFMDGEQVTKYMLKALPSFATELIKASGHEPGQIDSFFFHQANAYMIRFVAKRLKLDLNKVPINIERFGNTSSPSIPLLICDKKQELFQEDVKEKVLAVGFGSGFLIAGCIMELGGLKGGKIAYV